MPMLMPRCQCRDFQMAVIQIADKGNNDVILDNCFYISAIEEIFNENSKLPKLDISAGKETNHIINLNRLIPSGNKKITRT